MSRDQLFITFYFVLMFLILPGAHQKPFGKHRRHFGSFSTNTDNSASQRRRCGTPVFASATEIGDKWSKNDLTYALYNVTTFRKREVRKVFQDAIKAWTEDVNLRIREYEGFDANNADIVVHFTRQDGPGEVLGFAFYPENGDIFFDTEENWTLDKTFSFYETNFGWVAIHELGHALGLPHSKNSNSIMFPYYSSSVFRPTEEDVRNLRSKYGSTLCNGATISAILDSPTPIVIVGKQYWRFSGEAVHGGASSLDEVYPNLPDEIDAAFELRGKQFFLSDSFYYKFENDKSRRKLISKGFDGAPSNIDAAFFDQNSTLYFFKGSKYYALDTDGPLGMRLVVNGENIEKDWKVPGNIEAAMSVNDSRVMFVKKFVCYLVNLYTRELISKKDCSHYYRCN